MSDDITRTVHALTLQSNVPKENIPVIGRCPSCGSRLFESRCYKCNFCGICGKKSESGSPCDCLSGYLENLSLVPSGGAASDIGEVAPPKSEFSQIVGRHVSQRERDIVCAQPDRKGREIRSIVCSVLNNIPSLSERVKPEVLEEILHHASTLFNRFGCSQRESIPLAIWRVGKPRGLSAHEVIRAIALTSRLKLKLVSYSVTIQYPPSREVKVKVNGCDRPFRYLMGHMLMESQREAIASIRIPLYHSDLTDSRRITIELVGGRYIDWEKKYAVESNRNTLTLKIGYDDSSLLLKLQKKYQVDRGIDKIESNAVEYGRRFSLSVSRFPRSANIMMVTGPACLHRFNILYLHLFRTKMEDTQGRTPRKLVMEAQLQADREIFSSLNARQRQKVLLAVARMSLKQSDRKYTGVEGLLVRSEILGQGE
jgi:hypothetical protein